MPPGLGYKTSANRNAQKFGVDAVRRRLQGMTESSGMVGILGRGRNTYKGGLSAAHSGGGMQFGRPVGKGDDNPIKSTINRRLAQRNRITGSSMSRGMGSG